MSDVTQTVLVVVIAVFVPLDAYVFREFRRAYLAGVPIPALRLYVNLLGGILAGILLGALLGIHTIVFTRTGFRIIPQGIAALVIAAAIVAASVGVIPVYRQLQRWRREHAKPRIHKRIGEPVLFEHRRATDTAPLEVADDEGSANL